jgi:Tol biopolymer transport system component
MSSIVIVLACACSPSSEEPGTPTPGPTQALGSFGPEARIAFHSDPSGRDDTYVMDADGRELAEVTSGLETIAQPYWSPDGSQLVVACCTGGPERLLLIAGPGDEPVELAPGVSGASHPAWSPDGARIVFEATQDGSLSIVDVTATGTGAPHPLGILGAGPTWSPDGTRIAYFAERGGNLDIYVATADGTDEVRLTEDPAADHSPVWSPDGGSIAFVSERDGDQDVFVMNADGSEQRDVSGNPVPDDFPAWSPDGDAIAFVSYLGGADPLTIGDGNAEIFVVAPDGTGLTNISRNPAWDGDPAWSPDGTELAFTRRTDHAVIYTMRRDGRDQQRLRGVPDTANDCCPAWRPEP